MSSAQQIVGWSEYLEERNIGVTAAIEWMGALVVGLDALPFSKIVAQLKAHTRHVAGGIASQAGQGQFRSSSPSPFQFHLARRFSQSDDFPNGTHYKARGMD